MALSDDIVYYVALSRAKNIGPIIGGRIIEAVKDRDEGLSCIFESESAIKDILGRNVKKGISESLLSRSLMDEARRIVDWCRANDVNILGKYQPAYPELLNECNDAPLLLYAKGNVGILNSQYAISIVGTRNISDYGYMATNSLVEGLHSAVCDMTVVSGLAFGVDIAAHRKAIELKMPTIAVLAHGLDRIYPYQHSKDAHNIIASGGLLITEYPVGTNAERFNFVARNRIIAGVTKATLVVEAGLRSGSLITAEMASNYNREIFAVPGRIYDKYSHGCNDLINRMKAVLVSDASQILYYMGINVVHKVVEQKIIFENEDMPDNPIIKIISEFQPIHINDIVHKSGFDMNKVANDIFELELDGFVESMPGQLYIISKK